MISRIFILGLGCLCPTLIAAYISWNSPALCYRITGAESFFKLAVSRYVPRHGSLSQLTEAVGRGTRLTDRDGLFMTGKHQVQRHPAANPEGWCEGDSLVLYTLPNTLWFFRVRGDRLVNFDPRVIASQPEVVMHGLGR